MGDTTLVLSLTIADQDRLEGIKLKNWRRRGTLVPSTEEMVKTGVMGERPKLRAEWPCEWRDESGAWMDVARDCVRRL